MSQPELPVVLYHYAYSPVARRVVWYLQLRGIPYIQCMQPPIMPRADIASLGIKYRRIPILSIGRDVYLDSRLIIQKLEQLYPSLPRLGTSSAGDSKAIERLLETLTIDSGLFAAAMRLIPADLPLMKDRAFLKDRKDFTGGQLSREEAAALRPEAVNQIAQAMDLLETTLLADGREWILKTEKPTLADIEAVWPLHWLNTMPGALPESVSPKRFPRVYAWIARFQDAAKAARKAGQEPKTVSGEEARDIILKSRFNEQEGRVDSDDPLVAFHSLGKGSEVALWPTDTGVNHKDTGRLVSLDGRGVVIEPEAVEGDLRIRLHAPRHGFRVRPVESAASL